MAALRAVALVMVSWGPNPNPVDVLAGTFKGFLNCQRLASRLQRPLFQINQI